MRCRQLVDLLKKCDIPLPPGLPPECIAAPLKEKQQKWSNRIEPEMIDNFLKMIKKSKSFFKAVLNRCILLNTNLICSLPMTPVGGKSCFYLCRITLCVSGTCLSNSLLDPD